MAALVFMPAMAWDHLYIIGDGTPTGWSLNTPEPIEMDETAPGSNTYVTICYLDNAKEATFRLQPDRDWIEATITGHLMPESLSVMMRRRPSCQARGNNSR